MLYLTLSGLFISIGMYPFQEHHSPVRLHQDQSDILDVLTTGSRFRNVLSTHHRHPK
jgi:hypothetical protein